VHALSLARGASSEVETQVLIARRLHYLGADQIHALLAQSFEVGRLIHGLSNAIRKKIAE
jgi:four helix bundle protein